MTVERLSPITEEVIQLYETCRKFRCLPRAGGLYEQDAVVMDLLRIASMCRDLANIGTDPFNPENLD